MAFSYRLLHVMCDVLGMRHSGNGMVEYGRFLLVDATVDKQLMSIRIKAIAVEAFGRHLKRVDVSALFLFGCKIWPVKTYISIEKRRNSGFFYSHVTLLTRGCPALTCNGIPG